MLFPHRKILIESKRENGAGCCCFFLLLFIMVLFKLLFSFQHSITELHRMHACVRVLLRMRVLFWVLILYLFSSHCGEFISVWENLGESQILFQIRIANYERLKGCVFLFFFFKYFEKRQEDYRYIKIAKARVIKSK